ncbi:telomere length regulation protein-domain-containing protein [Panaeolus papilionaceus]|nr:telomere length regulation protein-domain-containing protein [Panaeolus papilionaceus]
MNMDSSSRNQIQGIIDRLQTQIPDLQTLLNLLTPPLSHIGLLPPRFTNYISEPIPQNGMVLRKHVPQIQRILITQVLPTWADALKADNAYGVVEQYFAPDAFHNALPNAGEVALLAYGTLLASSTPLNEWAVAILEKLVIAYPVDRVYKAAFERTDLDRAARSVGWEDAVKNLCMVPVRVANAIAGTRDIPVGLENGVYFENFGTRLEELVYSLSLKDDKAALGPLSYLLTKLVNIGLFPSSAPIARSQPSFFHSNVPTFRRRLAADTTGQYASYWSSVIRSISSLIALQSLLTSLLSSVSAIQPSLSDSPLVRAQVKKEAALLDGVIGKIVPGDEKSSVWQIATSLILSRDWEEHYARIFVCWISGGARGTKVNLNALEAFLEPVLETWASNDHVRHSLLSKQRYMTSLLLLIISYFPPSSQPIQGLTSHPAFLGGVSKYISHMDHAIRRLGMLTAEYIAQRAGKKLSFGDWDSEYAGKEWIDNLRKLLEKRDVDAKVEESELDSDDEEQVAAEEEAEEEGMDPESRNEPADSDDESVVGYASSSSSRAASPTPSELDEIEKDPMINVGKKKLSRPVYLAQVGELLRGTPSTQLGKKVDEPDEADRIEMGLDCAEELIRKKSQYGTELEENAANLVYALLALNNNYELEGFVEKRQGALNALVACAPRKAAPALIEHFFKNQFSADQRFVALNALAIGARELASLPVPQSLVPAHRIAFPSKTLPAAQHNRYITADRQLLPRIIDNISQRALEKETEQAETTVPEIIREKKLRMTSSSSRKPVVQEVTPNTKLNPYSQLAPSFAKPKTRFIDVGAEFFIMPFINRFWAFLQSEQSREQRTAHMEGRNRYHGAGTGMILNALVMAQFLRTMAIMVDAAQNAPEFLAIIASEALELAVTLGTRSLSREEKGEGSDDEGEDTGNPLDSQAKKEAAVLTSALELALVILNSSLELDQGRTLGLEFTALVLGVGEWAGKVFANIDKGLRFQGGGGAHEARLSRSAAGVLLKIDELMNRWRRSMLQTA